MKKVALLLAEGFEEVEAVTPADFLNRAGIEVLITGITGKAVKGAHNIIVSADFTLQNLPRDLDGVIIPGGMAGTEHVADSEDAINLIKKLNSEGKLVAAICAAPAIVLEKAGVIAGKKATCFPGLENRFTRSTFSEERVVVDGNVVTSRGPGTAAEFAIQIIDILAGKEIAQNISNTTLQK